MRNKDKTKVTTSWFLIHTELRCTVNHTSDNEMYTDIFSQSQHTLFGMFIKCLLSSNKFRLQILVIIRPFYKNMNVYGN